MSSAYSVDTWKLLATQAIARYAFMVVVCLLVGVLAVLLSLANALRSGIQLLSFDAVLVCQ
ncbi:hypothetical protein BVH01_11755 [Pseudomonas sp. PA1(2017)]|nr:hypothetical protein BVH01_11755 [Pseudomonas sp. PA1(2017)]